MACEYYYSLVAVILEYIVCFLLRLKLLLGRKGDIVGHVQWEADRFNTVVFGSSICREAWRERQIK